jgi:hypothetical protein
MLKERDGWKELRCGNLAERGREEGRGKSLKEGRSKSG